MKPTNGSEAGLVHKLSEECVCVRVCERFKYENPLSVPVSE